MCPLEGSIGSCDRRIMRVSTSSDSIGKEVDAFEGQDPLVIHISTQQGKLYSYGFMLGRALSYPWGFLSSLRKPQPKNALPHLRIKSLTSLPLQIGAKSVNILVFFIGSIGYHQWLNWSISNG